jgi:hypothetical protein
MTSKIAVLLLIASSSAYSVQASAQYTVQPYNIEPYRIERAPFGPVRITRSPRRGLLATITVKCGSRTITLTTGNDKGVCAGQDGVGGECKDGNENGGKADCTDGCTGASGSGSCK